MTWKGFYEDTQEHVAVHMYGFRDVERYLFWRTSYEEWGGSENENLKNGKSAGEAWVTREIVKGMGELVIEWIWKLCNIGFESGVVPEDGRSMSIPLQILG